ncbi:hypothetical protein NDU88_005572 [Pleurodeles waltl]|uniref:Serine carboxypeptidase CPVL n=1 Tax=Pleurodeles waltl TaxID=8319 RepID=A0AAV7MDC1_PLEWA|nr:hypothetical protein NDU88_005572 [Pleurodeles waltl]
MCLYCSIPSPPLLVWASKREKEGLPAQICPLHMDRRLWADSACWEDVAKAKKGQRLASAAFHFGALTLPNQPIAADRRKMQKMMNLFVMLSLAMALNLCSAQKWMSPFRKMFRGIKVSTPTREDPGKPLFLTPYLESGRIQEARELSLVGQLPGYNVKSYSGYLTVNKTYNSNLFFWFFPAQVEPENAPLLLWLQGGPGGTSMFGLFVEHGPYVVNKNLTLCARKYPWTSHYSLIYIDNPVGTGFSFTDDSQGFAKDQVDVGRDLYSALTQFLQIFPEYQKNDFYATGEVNTTNFENATDIAA